MKIYNRSISTDEVIIDDDDIPGGDAELPKTGELPPILFYGTGAVLALGGYLLRKKRINAK